MGKTFERALGSSGTDQSIPAHSHQSQPCWVLASIEVPGALLLHRAREHSNRSDWWQLRHLGPCPGKSC